MLGSLRLTFWILLACVALFFIGSFYMGSNYAYFDTMNEMTLQGWMINKGILRPGLIWWLPPVLIALFLLGLNTFCCSLKRIMALWPTRKGTGRRTFMLRLSPSLVHCFFLIILCGHCITSVAGSWERYKLSEGETIRLAGPGVDLAVDCITHTYYDQNSLLYDRIAQTTVLLRDSADKKITVSFLHPAVLGSYHLHLDMVKKRRSGSDNKQKPVETELAGESCNKEQVYKVTPDTDKQKLFLLVIRDPGIYLIMTGFVFILSLMTWYFVELSRAGDNKG